MGSCRKINKEGEALRRLRRITDVNLEKFGNSFFPGHTARDLTLLKHTSAHLVNRLQPFNGGDC